MAGVEALREIGSDAPSQEANKRCVQAAVACRGISADVTAEARRVRVKQREERPAHLAGNRERKETEGRPEWVGEGRGVEGRAFYDGGIRKERD